MRRWRAILGGALILTAARPAAAFQAHRVGTPVLGRERSDRSDLRIDKQFTLWVGVDESGGEHLLFKVDAAMVAVSYSQEVRQKLERLVGEAIESADAARKNNADASKLLGCLGSRSKACEKKGSTFRQNQLGFGFVATDGGQQADLVLSLVDRENPFLAATLHVGLPEMKRLLAVVQMIDAALEQARDGAGD